MEKFGHLFFWVCAPQEQQGSIQRIDYFGCTYCSFFTLTLMWIGASPAYGRRLKTTNFCCGYSQYLGSVGTRKESAVEVSRKRNKQLKTLEKSFASYCTFILVIGLGCVLIMIFNPELELI